MAESCPPNTPPPSPPENNFDNKAPSAHHWDPPKAAPQTTPATKSQTVASRRWPTLRAQTRRPHPSYPMQSNPSPPPQDSDSTADSKNRLSRPIPAPPQTAPTTPEKTIRPLDPQTPPPPAPTRLPPAPPPAAAATTPPPWPSLPPLGPR